MTKEDLKSQAAALIEAAYALGLEAGKEAYAIIKATNVMFATAKITGISARNQLAGTVNVAGTEPRKRSASTAALIASSSAVSTRS